MVILKYRISFKLYNKLQMLFKGKYHVSGRWWGWQWGTDTRVRVVKAKYQMSRWGWGVGGVYVC